MPSPEVEDAGSSAGPRAFPGGDPADPPGNPAAEVTLIPAGQAGTRNPAAAVAAVSTQSPAGGRPAAGPGAATPGGADTGRRDAVLMLQRHVLPAAVPVFPNVRLAARHLAGGQRPGDGCFDAFTVAGGTIGLMTGLAAGEGPEAVAAMAQLRTVLREALLAGAGLDEALARMDAAAAQIPGGQGASAGVGLLDPATGSLHYASAGQPAPLVCAPGGRAAALAPGGGGPLGVGTGQPRLADAVLPPGSVLVLGSGAGLGRPGPDAEERLAAAVSTALDGADALLTGSADLVCGLVAERLAGSADGDVTVLAAHHRDQPGQSLFLRMPGQPAALRRLRARLAAWLEEAGVSAVDRVDTELAVYEAAANAIVHGRPQQGAAMVTVEARLDGTGGALIEVTDGGRWRPAPAADRERPGGRGLALISKVTRELTISPSPSGTTVVMRRPLSHPVTVSPGW